MRIAAEAEERCVAQREQARPGRAACCTKGEDDHHAHLAEHGDHEAVLAVVHIVVEQPRAAATRDQARQASKRGAGARRAASFMCRAFPSGRAGGRTG